MTDSKSKNTDKAGLDTRIARRLFGYLKPKKQWLLVALVLTISVAILGPIRPYLTQIAIDEYIAVDRLDGLGYIIGLLFASLFGESILLVFNTYLTRWIGQNALYQLRLDVFDKLQHLHVQYFDRNPIGRLITRTTNDIEALDDLLSNGVVTILGDILRIGFIFYFMVMLNWELTLVSLSTLPFLFLSTWYFKKKVRVAFLAVRDQISRINSFIQEHINGMAVVQLFGREDVEMSKFQKVNARHRQAHITTIFYFALFWPVVEVISSVAMAMVIWWGGAQVLSGMVTFGVLVAFIQYVRQFFLPIRDLADKFNTLQSAFASSERIFEVLDANNDIVEKSNPLVLQKPSNGEIEFKNVWFRYDTSSPEFILKDVSFKVKPGETLAIVGATGAGKTTIINLLTRFYDIERGNILLDGVDIRDYSLKSLRDQFGLVLQDNALFSGSIFENITLGNERITREQVEYAAELVGAHSFIRKLSNGYDQELSERGASLSMGQRQLLCFVRALVYDPRVLVLDEATANVDSDTEALVNNAVQVLMKGRTSLVIAHRLATIQHAHRILVFHKGELRERGSHQQLIEIKDGIYRRLYELQYKDQAQPVDR